LGQKNLGIHAKNFLDGEIFTEKFDVLFDMVHASCAEWWPEQQALKKRIFVAALRAMTVADRHQNCIFDAVMRLFETDHALF
jgi:hypothetical protein